MCTVALVVASILTSLAERCCGSPVAVPRVAAAASFCSSVVSLPSPSERAAGSAPGAIVTEEARSFPLPPSIPVC
uniref:Putative secreted protein n=1 Tax=Anopheles triannulatus TaxID=58253 RepID=A0A2M4B7S1_9DIPT